MNIKVNPISVNTNGYEDYFGEETGTPEFYMVKHTLEKYLGEENIWVDWDYNEFFFIITDRCEDEGFDNIYDYSQVIETIYEPFELFNFVYRKKDHLRFHIINDE